MKTTKTLATVLTAVLLSSGLAAAPAHAVAPLQQGVSQQLSICRYLPWWPGCQGYGNAVSR